MTIAAQKTTGASEASSVQIGVCGDSLSRARARDTGARIGRIMRSEIEWVDAGCATSGADPHDSVACLTALRASLVAGECDLVVHALRDVPAAPFPGLVIGAVPPRADARDALCVRDKLTLAQLPPGSRVGAESPRRLAQLKAAAASAAGWDSPAAQTPRAPKLARAAQSASPSVAPAVPEAPADAAFEVVEVHGSAEERLQLVASGETDAVVLDAATLDRLRLIDEASEFFELTSWPTTPGQGALAVEVRSEDARSRSAIRAMLVKLDHRPTRAAITAERMVLERLDGHSVPFGASAILDSGMLLLGATAYLDDGRQIMSSHGVVLDGMSPAESKVAVEALGRTVANELMRHSADLMATTGRSS